MKYKCAKCNNTEYTIEEIRASGGVLSSMLDVENKKFTAIVCSNCKYTEFYKTDKNKISEILDFMTT